MRPEVAAAGVCGACLCVVSIVIFGVCMGSYYHLGPDDQVLLTKATGKYVQSGPWVGQLNPFHTKVLRKATLLDNMEYAVVQDILTGMKRTAAGPMLLFLSGYEEVVSIDRKIVLQKHQYMTVVDRRTGVERVLRGPAAVQPEHSEVMSGVMDGINLNSGLAVVVRSKLTGAQELVTYCSQKSGIWFPNPMEEMVDKRDLIHVLPYEAMIVRHASGLMDVYSGREPPAADSCVTPDASGVGGTAFFLPPFTKIVRMSWSTYPNPNEQNSKRRLLSKGVTGYDGEEGAPLAPGEDDFLIDFAARRLTTDQVYVYDEAKEGRRLDSIYVDQTSASPSSAPKRLVTAIDLRTQKSFYSYQVRTVDNVRLLLEGTIFWRIIDVRQMLKMTSDPEGDAWSKSRSILMGAVSSVSLATFMVSFNSIFGNAFAASRTSSFWTDRGLELVSLEMSSYRPTDAKTAETLQSIIRMSVQRTNELQKQESKNDVLREKLLADIRLEYNTTQLIEHQAVNSEILAEAAGAIKGSKDAQVINSYINGLNETLSDVALRLELFKQHKLLESSKVDAAQLTDGKASLYFSPKDMYLRLQMPSGAPLPVQPR